MILVLFDIDVVLVFYVLTLWIKIDIEKYFLNLG